MAGLLDPVLHKDLGEAKAALARHGIVILRGVERELEPAIMVAVRDSLASSPGKLRAMSDEDLDDFMEKTRRAVVKAAKDLSEMHTHMLAKLGTEYIGDLVNELEGIDQLFKWHRVVRVAEPADAMLKERGFRPVSLSGPSDVSEAFALELEEKWPAAYERFRSLAETAAEVLGEEGRPPKTAAAQRKKPRKR